MNAPLARPPLNDGLDRSTYIGSSDAAPILGVSPWRTALETYLDKVRPKAKEIDPGKQRLFSRGKRMEPYVIDLLAEEQGLEITARGNRYIDPELGYVAAEIDAETACGRNVEIKTVSPFKAKEWGEQQTDEIPVHYTAQVMHGLMVTGKDECIMGVLVGGDDFRVYRVLRDDGLIAQIRAKEKEFWLRVQTLDPPDPCNAADIIALYGQGSGTAIEASETIVPLVGRYAELAQEIKALEKAQEGIKEKIQMYMGEHSILALDGRPLATWRSQTSMRFNQSAFAQDHADLLAKYRQATTTRIFRVK